MHHLVRRSGTLITTLLVVVSLVAPASASASTIAAAFFSGGAGTLVVGGTLYARSGATVTLFVLTDAAVCVDVTGAVTARRIVAAGSTTWPFPFTAGTGNGARSVTVTAWSDASGTDCAGTAGEPRTVSFTLDNTGPVVTGVATPAANGAGWHQGDVAIAWSAVDAGVGVQSGPTPATATQSDETGGAEHTAAATDRLGNTGSGAITVRLDRTSPTVDASQDPAPNAAGWNRSDVTVAFDCADALSGVADCPSARALHAETAGTTVGGQAVDVAGNASAPAEVMVRIDRTPPVVALVGGPADGGSYDASSLPAAPGCDARDDLSGLDGDCSVEGYAVTPGTHTVTATARDAAGNDASTSVTYSVSSWTLVGFYRPVEMDAVNTVKGGSTVPLKFEVFDGATELTTTDVIEGLTVEDVGCPSGRGGRGPVPWTATGGAGVRYDEGSGRFEVPWLTPRTAGACLRVTVTTTDGSSLGATFRTR